MEANPLESLLKVGDAANRAEIDYEDVLKKIGFGKAQWLLMAVGALLILADFGALLMPGILAIASQCDFELSQSKKGLMMASCVAGVSLSTYFWGYATDAVGRRTVLLHSMLWSNLFLLISIFVTNFWVFIVLHFISGVSLGGISAGMFPFLSEFTTLKHRPVVINFVCMFLSVEGVFVPACAWLVLSYEWSIDVLGVLTFRPWRLIIFLNILPGFIGALLLLLFPETPKMLLSKKKKKEAVEAVNWLCQFNTGNSVFQLLDTPKINLKLETIADSEMMSSYQDSGVLVAIWKTTKPLFHKPHRFNFIICLVVVSGLYFSISTKTYIDNIVIGLASIIGYIVQGVLLNPVGRKNVLMASLVLSALSGILLHFVSNPTAVLILFCLFMLMPGLAISNLASIMSDLVPTHLRGKAFSLCFTLGRLTIIVATNLVGVMLEPLCKTTFVFCTGSTLICLMLVLLLPK